ncbi:MAG: hypothetical protein LBV34_00830, partial [Nocardiopsaceae bacterium]|nr:hypothetical protein [Nocardiopsaceae bacterium]
MMSARRSAAVVITLAAAICPVMVAGAAQAIAGSGTPSHAQMAAAAGTWQTAKNVPGVNALNKGGQA